MCVENCMVGLYIYKSEQEIYIYQDVKCKGARIMNRK